MRTRFRFNTAETFLLEPFPSSPRPAGVKIALALLLVMEFWIFSGSFHKFFTHDSLFYMIYAPHSWAELLQDFLAPCEEKNYRPLNLGLVALLRPFLGLDPQPYHWIPIVFHLSNTLLFYLLARRILAGSRAPWAAAAFWGLHSVAGWITYDITYLSDFLLAFLLLLTLLSAVEGNRRKSPRILTVSLFIYTLALLTKEAAITFPLAVWIVLVLVDLRIDGEVITLNRFYRSGRKMFPMVCWYAVPAALFSGLFIYWRQVGLLYTLSTHTAYSINPWLNPLAKLKYLHWGLNLPDNLSIPYPEINRALALGVMGGLLLLWVFHLLRRRGKLSAAEWTGPVWFVGLLIPALLLSGRLGKWYLYIPLFGLALAFGDFVESFSIRIAARFPRWIGLTIPAVLVVPILVSSFMQTRSYVVASDCSYQSGVLQACLRDFQQAHPTLPPQVTLFFLPAFDDGISTLLSVSPIDRGQLFALYYPGTRFRALFGHQGDRFPEDISGRSGLIILQYLDRRLYDVSHYFNDAGRMTLFLLPTSEGVGAPLLKKVPAGGWKRFHERVQLLIGDEGARLPDDYLRRRDIWVLQYMNGHFEDVTPYYINNQPKTMLLLPTIGEGIPAVRSLKASPIAAETLLQSHVRLLSSKDLADLPDDYLVRPDVLFFQYLGGIFSDVTDYYQGRRRDSARRVIRSLEGVRYNVSQAEYYPDYQHFGTPTGAPVFFPTPQKEILTQIGGSVVTVPLPRIPADSYLRFDVSWMYSQGDGAWAEATLRTRKGEFVVYCEYMHPDPHRETLVWKEVHFNLRQFAGEDADLILKCYNDPGKNTVADWLNWRDITIESK